MSVDISSWVWKHGNAEGSGLLVLLALADIANHDGICWPSVPTVASRTRLHEQTVRGHLQELERRGAITVEAQPGRSNRYRVLTPTPTDIATPSDIRTPAGSPEGTPTKTTQSTPTKPPKTNRNRTIKEPSMRGTRINSSWAPSESLLSWAEEKVPSVNVEVQTANFIDYWMARADKGAAKLDWDRTWQTWMRNAHERNTQRGWTQQTVDVGRDEWMLR